MNSGKAELCASCMATLQAMETEKHDSRAECASRRHGVEGVR